MLRVSIIIPTYNRPDKLLECLGSLEKQTVIPHEVIVVVDGGITTEVQEVIDVFKGKLPIVQINNHERKGGQVSRSIGLQAASGEIVANLDDDITLEPDWLAEILKGYQDNEDAAGVGGMLINPITFFSDNTLYRLYVRSRLSLFRRWAGKISFIGLPYVDLLIPSDNYLSVDFLNSGNASYRREILLSHGPDKIMDLDFVEEHNLGTILTRKEGRKLIYNSKAVAYHNHTRSSGSWTGDRMYYTLRDHTAYLWKNFDLKYLRLALFSIYVLALSVLFLKPRYLKAIGEGIKRYKNWATHAKLNNEK